MAASLNDESARRPAPVPPADDASSGDEARSFKRAILLERMKGWGTPVVGCALLALSLWVLHDVLRHFRYSDLRGAVGAIGWSPILLSLALTAVSFAALVGYEYFAMRFAGKRLSVGRTGLGAFIAQSISHTTGFAAFVATSLRYRIYAERGLTLVDVAKVQAFFVFTLGLGLVTLGGLVLLIEPGFAARLVPMPLNVWRGIGAAMVTLVVAYFLWSWRMHRPVRVFGELIEPPRPTVTLLQIGLAFIDIMAAAGAMWVLMPAGLGVSYPDLLGMYLAAVLLGIVSHVPGAIGVLEGTMLLLLAPTQELMAPVVASLLLFRMTYYLAPFIAGSVALAGLEFGRWRGFLDAATSRTVTRMAPLIPVAAAGLAVLAGTILLFSGVTPPIEARFTALTDIMPLPVIELAHVSGSVIGVCLLLLARPLYRRLAGAWTLAVGLLAAGIGASLIKGFDFEEATLCLVVVLFLLACRPEFYRRSRLLDERLSPGWWIALALIVAASIWLLIFAYRHLADPTSLLFTFDVDRNAPRSIRAVLVTVVLALAAGVYQLVRPARPQKVAPVDVDMAIVRQIVDASPAAEARLAFSGDKRFMFSSDGAAFIMYGLSGRSWIAMGEPVGPKKAWQELLWAFHEEADRHGGRSVFYEIGPDNLPFFLELGHRIVKLGERARVPLGPFELKGKRRQDLRTAINRAQKSGLSFEVVEGQALDAALPEIEAISDAWLAAHNAREKRFSLGYFSKDYLRSGPVAVVRREGNGIVAFCNLWLGAEGEECSIDLMRFVRDAGPGIMDYLMTECLLWAKARGYRWFDLGMAPLSGLPDHKLAPLWTRLGRLMVRHGAHFYNFNGLRSFKAKFDPVWEPAYLIFPDGSLPLVLADTAALIAGGWGGIVRK